MKDSFRDLFSLLPLPETFQARDVLTIASTAARILKDNPRQRNPHAMDTMIRLEAAIFAEVVRPATLSRQHYREELRSEVGRIFSGGVFRTVLLPLAVCAISETAVFQWLFGSSATWNPEFAPVHPAALRTAWNQSELLVPLLLTPQTLNLMARRENSQHALGPILSSLLYVAAHSPQPTKQRAARCAELAFRRLVELYLQSRLERSLANISLETLGRQIESVATAAQSHATGCPEFLTLVREELGLLLLSEQSAPRGAALSRALQQARPTVPPTKPRLLRHHIPQVGVTSLLLRTSTTALAPFSAAQF